MIKFLFVILFSLSAQAQVYFSETAQSIFDFNGTLIKRGFNSKGAATITSPAGKKFLRVVFEVKDFNFATDFEYSEFNDEFFESQYFPQIRISGDIPAAVDFSKNGLYEAEMAMQFTMRQIPKKRMMKVFFQVNGDDITVTFKEIIKLNEYNIPYAGTGSDIGADALFDFKAELVRSYTR